MREVLFRDAVLNFLGVTDKGKEDQAKKRRYCLACRKMKKDDCDKCEFK